MHRLSDIIRDITSDQINYSTVVCKVESVDNYTCDVIPVDTNVAPIKKVRLNADIEKGNGIVIVPQIDSMVMVTLLNDTDAFISMFSEIQKVHFIDTNDVEYTIENGEINLKADKLTSKIGNIQCDIGEKILIGNGSITLLSILTDLIDKICAITVPTGTGPSGMPINTPEIMAIKQNISNLLA